MNSPLPSRLCPLLLAALAAGPALAGTADIANAPLGTTAVRPKPNVMFILDDSGSMDSRYMPDEMSNSGRYGYYSYQCNGVAYNPSVQYLPPVDYQGNVYPNATFNNAWRDGYNTGGTKTNLDTAATEATYYRYTGSQTAMGWVYLANGSVDTTSTFYSECMTTIGNSAPFTAVRVTSASAEAQNYANWFAYYRTRMNMMRTATGRAFKSLDSNYRVGFTVISDSSASGTQFLDVADFSSGSGGQKARFYEKLYTVFNQDYTPLRGALAKIGQYYGNVAPGQTTDPVQYSCQRNYAILSTDGYWNTDIETGTYGPYGLNGAAVGQQDGDEVRPMKDSATTTVTTVSGSRRTDRRTYDGTASIAQPVQRVRTDVASSNCSSGKKKITTRTQTATSTSLAPRIRLEDVTVTVTTTVIVVNGVQTSSTTNTSTSSATLVSDTVGEVTSTTIGSWANGTATTSACTTTSAANGTTYSDPVNYGSVTTTWYGGTPAYTTATVPGTQVPYPDPPTVTSRTTGGYSNALADVAEYYWKTDLRAGMSDDVLPISTDAAPYQHMNTFTVGLGVKGTLTYAPDYLTQTSGDYVDLKSGAKNWPNPASFNATRIDDLWHAAVNGRGQYFSATNPTSLSDAIATTLSRITEQTGAGAAAAASTLTPTQGDDWIFLPSYAYTEGATSWYGDLRAFKFIIDSDTGELSVPDTSVGNEVWSAKTQLDARNLGTTPRTIYFKGASGLTAFTYDNLTTAGLNGSFDNRCTTATTLFAQCAGMTATAKAKVTGANLVDYLRGDTARYLNAVNVDDRVFRTRSSRLGDFINASPVYVAKSPFKYTDAGYAAHVSSNANRTKMVYAAANDGMLHAFKVGTGSTDSSGGTELWAYIPNAVIPELWRLADSAYDANHRYFVDATPVVADIYDGSRWRTILVGGLGGGGKAYYALDITTPETPSVLWEISNATSGFENLGLTYGNPVITKNSDGTWVVAFTTGLNNVGTGADGVGRLYVVNAATGIKISEISTGAGSAATPSNLSRIDGWVDDQTNNTALRFYGGDMLGNLWRFDHDSRYPPAGREALLLGSATAPNGAAQPITSKPTLSEVKDGSGAVAVVSFGTGRYLGTSDLQDTTVQSIYSVRDKLAGTTLCGGAAGPCALRSGDAKLVQQTLSSSRLVASPNAVDWATRNGWYVDLDQGRGERVFLQGVPLASGVLGFASSVPGNNICQPGGVSYFYTFDLLRGSVTDVSSYNTVIVGTGRVMDSRGHVSGLITLLNQRVRLKSSGSTSPPAGTSIRRATWRELID